MSQREVLLRRRVRICTWVIIVGLVVSGATAIPLQSELEMLARSLGAESVSPSQAPSGFVRWIIVVRDALRESGAKHPFLGYGTDWLAFAHFVIALVFVGALLHPLRNAWLFTFGLMACVLVIPWALVLGELRGIPVGWRLIDCAFGVLGAIPNWLARRWTRELEKLHVASLRFDE